ncbi:MAG: endolytic transglycosylase MltG [Eubacteriales bacterium]
MSRRSYLTGEYLSGELTVNPMMSYDTLINTLADYERSQSGTVRITIPEGLTVNETIDLLVQNGVGRKEDYLEALQSFEYEYRFCEGLTPEALSEYRFDTDYSYRLEGYLFPDTYDFYLNENPVSVLDKFLVNFDKKFEEEFYERCDDLGMTVDEIITLASMIEKEGNNPEDYYLISSVFHNRLNNSANYPYLNSDATLQYALQERSDLYNLDTTLDHPYNTYKYKGLPPGPISNPGTEAIYAALYPVDTSYYFFYTKKNGETVYSRTFEEHQRYINADKAG